MLGSIHPNTDQNPGHALDFAAEHGQHCSNEYNESQTHCIPFQGTAVFSMTRDRKAVGRGGLAALKQATSAATVCYNIQLWQLQHPVEESCLEPEAVSTLDPPPP